MVVEDPLAEILLLPPATQETAALVEPLGARVVGLGPQLRPVVTPPPRLGEQGVDESPTDALAPALGRDEDHGDVAEPWDGRPRPVIVEPLHAKRHADYLAADFGDQQERARCAHVNTRPRLLVGRWLQAVPPGGIRRDPNRDRRLDVSRSTVPYGYIADPGSPSWSTASDPGGLDRGRAFSGAGSYPRDSRKSRRFATCQQRPSIGQESLYRVMRRVFSPATVIATGEQVSLS